MRERRTTILQLLRPLLSPVFYVLLSSYALWVCYRYFWAAPEGRMHRWLSALLFTANTAWLAASFLALLSDVRFARGLRRIEQGCCAACGYDLRAASERCPECGWPRIDPQRLQTLPPDARLPAGVLTRRAAQRLHNEWTYAVHVEGSEGTVNQDDV
jgi:hypothetical protein